MADTLVSAAFAHNRAEELGLDVWNEYLIPFFFSDLLSAHQTKPTVFVGGRGCGKTMLLRYLSHYSAFSPNRAHIDDRQAHRIGLYWKADTHFVQQMHGRGLSDDEWCSAFDHFLAIALSRELLSAIANVARSSSTLLSEESLAAISLPSVGDYGQDLPTTVVALLQELMSRERLFQIWVNNVRRFPAPTFIPANAFLGSIINDLCRQGYLTDAVFHVYIDEYENLREYQQRMINTCIKHSAPPLVYNIATKRYGIRTHFTESQETISERDDYRTFDLDLQLHQNFAQFAAEVFFFRLERANLGFPRPAGFSIDLVRDVASLEARRQPSYRRSLLDVARQIFPGRSMSQIAEEVLSEPPLRRKLEERIVTSLKHRGLTGFDVAAIQDCPPAAVVILPALFARKRLPVDDVFDELETHRRGEPSRFTHGAEWIHNNLFGCLLQAYTPFDRPCPLYAGFDTFIIMCNGNIRHFLEICHKSLEGVDFQVGQQRLAVGYDVQARSAHDASESFLREIQSFGSFGVELYQFVRVLGRLFQILHRKPSQSEPEVTQFSIAGGAAGLDESEQAFLREAVKWSVLAEHQQTKTKDRDGFEDREWQIAPFYAPAFHISYRRNRSISLQKEAFAALRSGNVDVALRALVRRAETEVELPVPKRVPTLFDALSEEAEGEQTDDQD